MKSLMVVGIYARLYALRAELRTAFLSFPNDYHHQRLWQLYAYISACPPQDRFLLTYTPQSAGRDLSPILMADHHSLLLR